MKRITLLIIAVFSLSALISAQNIDDALRYSRLYYGGTARFMSMGGAFTALGGDISSLSQNPAGLGVFRSSELTLTPQLLHNKVNASFNGISSDYLYNFNLNQGGIVSNLISNSNETGLITLNFGYSFNKTNNLNRSTLIRGEGTSSSMADSWALRSEGFLKDDLEDELDIAYQTWLTNELPGSGGLSYGTVYSNYGQSASVYGQNVRRLITEEGYTGEHAFSIGGNYSNKVFFGATLGINRIKFSSHLEHLESTDIALPSEFKNFTFTDHFENKGTGYALKMGAIIKPIEAVRIGLAFHSPTIYTINETFYKNITSNFTNGGHHDWSIETQRYVYNLTTPFRALAGVAVQIKKIALLSADYEFVDYSVARFSEAGDDFDYSEKNLYIKQSLKSASNIRLGGEVRINKLYLRTGYGYYGKAFQAGEDNADLDYTSLSFGAGFREKNVSIDFAFTNFSSQEKYFLYPLDDTFDQALANLSTNKNLFTVTLGYKFGY
jgi:hypothetical protein